MPVRIVTDSAACLSAEERHEHGIVTVNLHVDTDGRSIPESELQDERFPGRLEALVDLPTTSQPTPGEFAGPFLLAAGREEEVLAILISGDMSGTVHSARIAADATTAEHPGARIEVLGSRSNSLEEGFAVLSAAEAASAGATLEECRAAAEQTMARTRFLFTPHSLEYLRRGGRISRASALLGVMLQVVPVLTAENGTTGVAGVARTGRSAWRKVASLMRKDVERYGLKRAAVQYFADEDEARRFAAQVVEPIAGQPVPLAPIHPVVGVHVGPAVGVVYETVEPMR